MIAKWLSDRANRTVLGILVAGLLVRCAIAFWLYPGFDEAYYYLYSQKLDWSYFDHPVLVALTTGIGPWLTGEVSQFTIRLGTLILHTISLWLLYLTAARLFSDQAGRLTLAIASIVPIFLVGFGVLTLPDTPLIFFWSASLYCAAREFFAERDHYQPTYRLAILGLLVGLACIGKYHGFILGLGFVGFCLTSARHRQALISPWCWLGVGLFILALSPLLIWNVQHDWISLRFQSGRSVPRKGYDLLALAATFFVGIAYLFPAIGFPFWWVTLQSLRQQWQGFGAKSHLGLLEQRLVLWVSLPLILGFTFMGGYLQVLPTWAMPGFWSATLLLGDRATHWSSRTVRRWLVGSGLTLATIFAVLLLHLNLGTLQQPSRYAWFGGFLPPQIDPSIQLVDIQQLRQGFRDAPELRSALERIDYLFTNNQFLGGQIGMALVPLTQKPLTCFDEDLRGFAFWSRAEDWVGKNALYITSKSLQPKVGILPRYQKYFSSFAKIGEVPILRGGVATEVFYVYEAKNLLKPYPRPYGLE